MDSLVIDGRMTIKRWLRGEKTFTPETAEKNILS
jgi:hypothetical protein